jgi:hypothetical protein
MTLDECRAHVGDRVAYRAGSRLAVKGAITKLSTAAYPEELTLLEEPS